MPKEIIKFVEKHSAKPLEEIWVLLIMQNGFYWPNVTKDRFMDYFG